jgi:hypothetical protein
LSTLFLEVTLKKHASNASYFAGESLIKDVELEIGGTYPTHYTPHCGA